MKYLALLLFFTASPVFASLQDGIIECWDLDETSGNRAGYTGTYTLTDTNTVLYQTGLIGNAADFELSLSETLNYGSTITELTGNYASVTMAVWVKLESNPTSGNLYTMFAGYRNLTTYHNYHQMYYYNNSGTLQLLFTRQSNNFNNAVPYNVNLNDSAWHHVGLTYGGSTQVLRVYLDGVEVGSTTSSANGVNGGLTGFALGSNLATGLYYDGLQDVAVYYNEVKSSAEMAELYASGSGVDCDYIVNGAPAAGGGEETIIWFMGLLVPVMPRRVV